jgi:hypothetical protein
MTRTNIRPLFLGFHSPSLTLYHYISCLFLYLPVGVRSGSKPLIRTAAELGTGLGFFTHAFPHSALQDRLEYEKYVNILEDALCEINNFAGECGCGKIGVEQMYTPHQYPWKRKQLRSLLRNVKAKSGRDFYFTEDVGHHQNLFQKPDIDILEKTDGFIKKEILRSKWFGSDKAYALAEKGMIRELQEELEMTSHLFSDCGDENCYSWISEFGCYSPIIHLQQTDGNTSSHYPFTNKRNSWGIIESRKLLEALKEAYDRPDEKDMPERCNEIYLTLELFIGTASIAYGSLADIKESVSYWRTIVPKDGVPLDKLIGW